MFHEENQAYWGQRSAGYARVHREELEGVQRQVWRRALSARLPHPLPEGFRVLDVGTGPGFFAILLAEMGCTVTAVDYTEEMLVKARIHARLEGMEGRICFLQMSAEALDLPSASFDAVVSRNLTWNLSEPEKAYAEWVRVLRPGGRLLNFDANWYRYLFSAEALEAHLEDRKRLQTATCRDETAGTDVAWMEDLARRAPLSRKDRPAWDRQVLEKLGLQVSVDVEAWRRVWTEEERTNNASTPLFQIIGKKDAQAEVHHG